MFDLEKLIDQYYNAIEKYNTNLINLKSKLWLESKEKRCKRTLIKNILKSDKIDKKIKILYNFEKIVDNINNDKRLLEIYNRFRQDNNIEILKKFIKRRNQIVMEYGYQNYNDFFIARVQGFGYENFEFNKMIQNVILNIVPYVYKLQNEKMDYDIKISSNEFEKTLSKINQKIHLLYKELNNSGKILLSHPLCERGALNIYMPKSNQYYICTKDSNLEQCYDFIAHELGHVFERMFIDKEDKLHTILIDGITSETYSSILELLFITNLSDSQVTKKLNIDYISQIAYQMLNLSIEYELNQNPDKISEEYLGFLWNDMTEKLLIYKKKDSNFTWNKRFNLSLDMFSTFKYLLGKIIAFLMKENDKLNYENFIDLCKKRNLFDIVNLKQDINLD